MPRRYHTSIGSFTRKSTFFWAGVGATVGLANLLQFPYLASVHGGGLFILLYLCCLLAISLPLITTEAVIGRYARHGILLAMHELVRRTKRSRAWMAVGRLSILAAFLVLSFTVVFGAIALAYVFFGALGRFSGAGEVAATGVLAGLVSNPDGYQQFMGWHVFFLVMVLWVSGRGVVGGLERAFRVVVPVTLALLLALFGVALWQGRVDGSFSQILAMQPENLSWGSLRSALFHAFFSLGLGVGVWAILGAYTAPNTPLKRSVVLILAVDTLVAVVAGLMIFGLFSGDATFNGQGGIQLLFVALPVALAELPGSQFMLVTVFLLVVMIIWATALALLEPVIDWFRGWAGTSRGLSVAIVGLAVWVAGLGSLFSFNIWQSYRFGGATLFRWLELVTGGVMVPLVAILVALFAGWCLTRHLSAIMLGEVPRFLLVIGQWGMRLLLPLMVLYIGIHYTAVSLVGLCDNGGEAVWCESSTGRHHDGEGTAFSEAPPADEAGADNMNNEEAEPLLPTEQKMEEPHQSPSDRPHKDDDILYHSAQLQPGLLARPLHFQS